MMLSPLALPSCPRLCPAGLPAAPPHTVLPLRGPPGTLCHPDECRLPHILQVCLRFSTITSQTTHSVCSLLRRLAGCPVSSRVGFLTFCLVSLWPAVISWLQPEMASVTGRRVVGRLPIGAPWLLQQDSLRSSSLWFQTPTTGQRAKDNAQLSSRLSCHIC